MGGGTSLHLVRLVQVRREQKSEPSFIVRPAKDILCKLRLQMIGVVADSVNDGLDKPAQPALNMPYSRFLWMDTQFLVCTEGSPLASLQRGFLLRRARLSLPLSP